ncbi:MULTISPECIES: DUF1028 domain-containing protein [unclassified Halomonas]|uniref:DUF1028 domain-containing protein n=1 Tax=unclassified Halomonas TaxID=2609666 RepID=UPI00054F076A|nr:MULTISPECIES: DUF1028 domain-containing protein [unclassified Halomonas]CEP34344.1 Putative uncharacterized protein [Halomonas sp. R57-5]
MTLSLVHCNPATGTVAAITATGGVAVGGYVHHCWRGTGACVTQGRFTNPWYPARAYKALAAGASAQQALGVTVSEDNDSALRQCLVMDAQGRSSVHSGAENVLEVAETCFPSVAAVGNMLQSAEVVQVLAEQFLTLSAENSEAAIQRLETPRYPIPHDQHLLEHLIGALDAALIAGGDRRGARSAALRIESFHQAPIDLRVDWSENVVGALRSLADQFMANDFQAFWRQLPLR